MAKVLRCRDLGTGCPAEIRADSEEELMKLAAEHAEKDHGISAAMVPPSCWQLSRAPLRTNEPGQIYGFPADLLAEARGWRVCLRRRMPVLPAPLEWCSSLRACPS